MPLALTQASPKTTRIQCPDPTCMLPVHYARDPFTGETIVYHGRFLRNTWSMVETMYGDRGEFERSIRGWLATQHEGC